MNRKRITKVISILFCLLLVVGYFLPLPYYVSKPGMARELEPIIKVANGESAEGSFMLTTISMGKANIYTYALANFVDYWGIYKEKEIRRNDETDAEYEMRQLYMMEGSKEKAIMSAFSAADQPFEVMYKGIYIYSVIKNMPAANVLQAGDRITKVNNHILKSSEQFTKYIAKQKEGSTIKLEIIRDKKTLTKEVKLQKIPNSDKLGIGIYLADDIEVDTDPTVKIESDSIGGPSAGLMFSLEIYNQLMDGDITKGYDIAGTGTINEKGEVGAIGGIDQKVVAADKSGAKIFFAPRQDDNYSIAKKTAEDINSSMEIVPVDSMQDALDFLKKMK